MELPGKVAVSINTAANADTYQMRLGIIRDCPGLKFCKTDE